MHNYCIQELQKLLPKNSPELNDKKQSFGESTSGLTEKSIEVYNTSNLTIMEQTEDIDSDSSDELESDWQIELPEEIFFSSSSIVQNVQLPILCRGKLTSPIELFAITSPQSVFKVCSKI